MGITSHALGSAKSVREWTLTLPSELPLWELESQMDSRIFIMRFQGSKPIGSKSSLYHWKKLLKFKCLEWACMTHLDIWNTSYDQKKGRELNWQFDFRPLKVWNRSDFLACRQIATYRWKALNEGYNFSLDLIAFKGLHVKLWAPKVIGVPGQKAILMWPLWRGAENTIKGEGGGFPQVRAVVSLVSPSLPVARPSAKNVQIMH
jgi:hypothetical protein